MSMKGECAGNSTNGDWVVKSTKKVFENPFFAVFEDDVIKPTGDEGKYATVRFKTGVAVLPIDDEGNIYLTRQFRYAIGRYDVEVVAGSIEGEAALDAAKRELKEELGIEAEEWLDMGSVFSMTSITQSTSRQFIATRLSFGEQETEGTEDIEPLKIRLVDACAMVHAGEITDADTCLLILKAAALNEKKAAGPSGTAANLRTGGVS
jgi:8-oxo-dGTP pyrophosphatase MutT (NUDIX family)